MLTQPNLTLPEFRSILRKCSGKTIVLDTETTGVYWWRDRLVTVGFVCPSENIEGSIDVGFEVEDPDDPRVLKFQREVREAVNTLLAAGTTVVMHNAKFDMSMLGVPANGKCNGWHIVDTTVLIHLYDSRMLKAMEKAEKELLGANSKRAYIEKAPTNIKTRKKVWLWPANVRQDYCINDCRVTLQFAQVLIPLIKKLELSKLFLKEMKYIKLVYKTEHYGIMLDQAFVGKAQMALIRHQKELEQKLLDAVGYEFNWRSNEQLSYALYESLGIPKPINPFATDKGEYTTRFGFKRIKELKGGMYNKTMTSTFLLMEKVHHPLGELVASLREASKLVKTCSLWLNLVDENSIIHSNFNLTGTRTGRLSSSKPNLANVASEVRSRFTQGLFSGGVTRSDEYNLRNAFVARPGHKMLSIDYRQMEMRFFGIDSQDENLLQFLASGKDIHLMIALKVWGDCGPKENKIHREWSKTIAFGLIYGMTTGSLEHKLGMSRAQAAKVIEDYWGSFPRIRPWLFETVNTCKQQGYLRYWSGRIWREDTEMFMYKGANAKVQGGCADLFSIAAMRTDEWLSQHDAGHIVSFVYDEILMEVKDERLDETANAIATIMQVPDLFGLPFLTDCKYGSTYGDLEKMDNIDGVWCTPKPQPQTEPTT